MLELTPSQEQILRAFEDALTAGEAPPTYRELCSRFGWSSTATARDHLAALVRKGALRRSAGRRNYRLTQPRDVGCSVPILGRVAAGRPILAEEHLAGAVTVPAQWVRGSMFAARVEGDSMTGVGIMDGDLIVAKAGLGARDRDIVVARVGTDVTVKRLRLRRGRAELVPENTKYRPVETDADTAVIGVVVGLVRDFATRKIGGPRWAR